MIPNGGEISAQTGDGSWILTKSQNNRTAVFVNSHAKDKNLADVTSDIDQLVKDNLSSVVSFEYN